MVFRMRWPTQRSTITQRFGENPGVYGKFGLPGHEGVDLVAAEGSEVFAVADGLVSDVRLDGFSDPMLKPYGNQVRIQHSDGYETIYAHLLQAVVVRGQWVRGRQLIGLAGNTGHSTGAHLHLSLKKQGATVAGITTYPYDLIDPEPFLAGPGSGETEGFPIPKEPTLELEVDSPAVGYLNVRALPFVGSPVLTRVDHGSSLGALEDVNVARVKVGWEGQWLWVQTPGGDVGWVAARYTRLLDGTSGEPDGPSQAVFVIVDSPEESLRLRAGPGTQYEEVTRLAHGTNLRALEDQVIVEQKVGTRGQWVRVQAPDGRTGYCAAWYLKLRPFDGKPVVPEEPTGPPTSHVVVESPELGLRLRAGPGTDHERLWSVPHKTVLTSLEDPVVTGHKVKQQGEWIHVRTPALVEGYAAAWYLRHPEQEDVRELVNPAAVPTGVSPHVFGIHALALADDHHSRDRMRALYSDKGKRGWILFTEICGRHAHTITMQPEIRRRLWDWADEGYGVIVRLNHGYEPGGTLPESRLYDDYASAAARWVEVYLRDPNRSPADYSWTIQIGNEQNNPREHPGGFEHPVEHITPERYADAFNRTYSQIKRVLPNAIVCPGALDPYNYMPMQLLGGERWRPLDYFVTMLNQIEALDGVILHAYTHGPDTTLVTHLKRFGDGTGPLWDHYYDFQTYRVFMERIPARWRDVPVYITEINHIHRPSGEHDQGWLNQNSGWIQAVYAEIDRWNQMPYAQQIRCGLIYRWMGDAWSIEGKPEVLADFREALNNDYRWRAMPSGGRFAFAAGSAPSRRAHPEELEERFLVHPDDLTVLWGIGDKAQAALQAAGILIFEQLAELTPDQLEALLVETGLRTRYLASWPHQARLALRGDWEALERYREQLSSA